MYWYYFLFFDYLCSNSVIAFGNLVNYIIKHIIVMRKTIMSAVVVIAALVAFVACKGSKSDVMHIDYEEYTLDNGLKVVLHEDHSDPIVAQAIAFHVGSAREKEGTTGFAHFFEHHLL